MDERVKFIASVIDGTLSMSILCETFGISRKTGYKWVKRYREEGPDGLFEKSRMPHSNPNRVSFAEERLIITVRKKHPTWGPKKILAVLESDHPELDWPATSTIGSLLKRRGLVHPKKKRERMVPYSQPFKGYDFPNAVWCADFKGDFKTQDGIRCYPLTITDGYSRYLLKCKGLPGTRIFETKKEFEKCFKEFGLPNAIRTDNGNPFASGKGFSVLSVWWIKLGILPERIQPGKPQQNGRHERMHRTLKAEAIYPVRHSMRSQQLAFDEFIKIYNHERPHEALGQKTPSSLYRNSFRQFPSRIPEIVYPDHFELRKVSDGCIYWKDRRFHISKCLSGEYVGLEPLDDGLWGVNFSFLRVAFLNEKNKKLTQQLKV
jgi:transposase InsO family protein